MKCIVLFGAGKSASVLIDYLKIISAQYNWQVFIADASFDMAAQKTGDHPNVKPVQLDVYNNDQRASLIQKADVVISLLPPSLHILVAKDCLRFTKHLLTASYVDEHIKVLENDIKKRGVLFLCEMGLDPGIDHMSAMQMIHRIQNAGGVISSFKSHCGGLVAPENDNNPWHYKISWNPRNIIIAGKEGAVYKENNENVSVTYEELFANNKTISIPGLDNYCFYPNRDSLRYEALYGLTAAHTFLRTTLRHPDFCSAWKHIIDLHFTEEGIFYDTDVLSFAQFFKGHLDNYYSAANGFDNNTLFIKQLQYLGLHDDTFINRGTISAAAILQYILEQKLSLQPHDKDMVVMLHQLEYSLQNNLKKENSCLIIKGNNNVQTAMAKTVGLPLGIAAKLLLENKLTETGLHIPIIPSIYEPVLKELAEWGIKFEEV